MLSAQPLGEPQLYNVTLIGQGGEGSGSDVLNTRSEYYGQIHNSVFLGFQGKDITSSVANNSGVVSHNLFWDNAGDRGIVGVTNAPAELNPEADPMLMAIDRGQNQLLDPRPLAASPVFSEVLTPPANGHLKSVAYKGAFNEALWCQDWTALADNQHLVLASKVIVGDPITPPLSTITVTATRDGANLVLTWTGSSASYTVRRKSSVTDPAWAVVASTTAATLTVPIEAGVAFYQVIAP